METRVEREGKVYKVIIQAGGESRTATFKTEQEAIDYKNFMEGLANKLKSRSKRITRMQAAVDAFKELNESGFTNDEFIKRADDIFSEGGGKTNIKAQGWDVRRFFRILGYMGTGYVIPEINLKKGV